MTDNSILLERVRVGDKKAEEELVKNNLRLVYSIAYRFQGRGYDNEDLFQIGAMGLIKAIHKFDTSHNVKFSTYAVPLIAGEIKRFLRDDSMIKISRSLKESAIKGKRYQQALRIKLGREPTMEEISEESGISTEVLIEAFDAVMPVDTITPTTSDGEEKEFKIKDDKNQEDKIIDKLMLKEGINKLEERERQVVIMRYFDGKTQSEVAEKIGVSQVQVSRIERATVEKLKRLISG